MITGSSKFRSIQHLLRDRAGNFGILTALAIPVVVAAAGVAVDVSNRAVSDSQLQEATDAAALATATALANGSATTAKAQQLATDFVTGQMANYLAGDANATNALKAGTTATVTQTSNSSGGTSYSVVVNASYDMPVNGMTHVLGINTMNVSASSTSSSGTTVQKSALSMEIALDKSGSMLLNTNVIDTTQKSCIQYYTDGNYLYQYSKPQSPCYIKKIAALKTAVGTLLDQLDAADPKSQYVRTAGIAWSSEVDSSSSLAWGTASTRTNVISGLNANGGTESSAPMTLAYNSLTASSEAAAQATKGNTNFQKIIVLMTDGENNASSSDTKTLNTCAAAKKAGVQIYTVAFMAPTRGQNLLQSCATSPTNYFQAEQMSDLIAAFKTIGAQASKQLTLLTK
ncbi:VWA domain-containing protein [Rhizobium calliandrae]|uniref:VWA domain-containing protein n=1 Tax=Rhizobium calliandrae TaxID=1312182 RepID=A0ABT7KA49_9HYPH|nr:VWA domain-containing protein [Rhizobium calliandrae]MDL2405496.1 VWA domain-containing protein [Rhizobium calliandrae]